MVHAGIHTPEKATRYLRIIQMNYGQTERTETPLSNTKTTVPLLFNLYNNNGFILRLEFLLLQTRLLFQFSEIKNQNEK